MKGTLVEYTCTPETLALNVERINARLAELNWSYRLHAEAEATAGATLHNEDGDRVAFVKTVWLDTDYGTDLAIMHIDALTSVYENTSDRFFAKGVDAGRTGIQNQLKRLLGVSS